MMFKPFFKRISHIHLLVISIFAFILSGTGLYLYSYSILKQQTYNALTDAIDIDYHNRDMAISQHSSSNNPHHNRKIKHYKLVTADSIYHITFKDSIYTSTADKYIQQLQMAKTSYAICPDELAQIFRDKLSAKEYPSGIIYRYKDHAQYSRNDSISPQTAYRTPVKSVDFLGYIRIQGWVNYDFLAPIRYMPYSLWYILILELLVIAGLSGVIYRHSKQQAPYPEKQEQVPLSEKEEEQASYPENQQEDNKQSVSTPILFDWDNKRVIIQEISYKMCKLDMQILSMIHECNDYFITRQKIKEEFWPNSINAEHNINTHINSIRKALKDTGYELITIKEKGYKLILTDNPPIDPIQ